MTHHIAWSSLVKSVSFNAASMTNSLIVPAHLLTPRTLTSLNRVRKCPDQLQLGRRRMGIMGTYTAVAWSWSQANAMSESPFHWKWRCSAKTTCSILLHTAGLVLVPFFCNHYIETSWFLAVQNSSIGYLVCPSVPWSGTTNNQSLHNTTEWP